MKYTYEITSVDAETGMMEVTYTNADGDSVVASCEIPTVDDSFKSYINAYAPVYFWSRKNVAKATVTQGETGDIWSDHPEETEDEFNARVAAEEASANA